MQTDALKKHIQEIYRDIASKLPGFRNRYTQRLFIAEIVKMLTNSAPQEKLLTVEGPTGTGKTLAYLLACIPTAMALNKKLVITTATVALQSQLMEKDIPLVNGSDLLNFKIALAKGRRRYLCPSLLEQQVESNTGQQDAFASSDYLNSLFNEMQTAFTQGEWSGDKDSWHFNLSDDIWLKVSNDRHGCLAAKCKHFRDCPYFISRQEIEEADVIIANHDLLLSDLSLGGGVLLPAPEETIYVIDEAHHLPEKTINHAGTWTSMNGTLSWLDRAAIQLKQIETSLAKLDVAKLMTATEKNIILLKSTTANLSNNLNQTAELNASQNEVTWRFPKGIIPENLKVQTHEMSNISTDLLKKFQKIKDTINRATNQNEITPNIAEALLPNLGNNIARLENVCELLSSFNKTDNPNEPPTARWITRTNNNEVSDFRLASSPTSATQYLKDHLWQSCFATIMTSATLVSLGSFGYFQRKAGLDAFEHTRYTQLASPFDFQHKATLWIPAMDSDPSDSDSHSREIIQKLPELLTPNEGTLVLFSSWRQMHEVAENLPDKWKQALLMQGDHSLGVILDKHKKGIENNESSVIFGLASFAEGIDLPGKLCTHVVIAKLPFAAPDSPVEATEREYIESQGQNHFREVVLPQTSIRLIQAVGRLIRNENDSGKVTILDRRLISKSYGKTLLQSLPAMRQVIE